MNNEGQSNSNDVGRQSSLMIGSSRRRSKRNRKIVDLSRRFLEDDDHTQNCTTFRRNSRRRSLMTAYNMETNCQSLPLYEDIGDCDNVCQKCYAYFWYDERVIRDSRVGNPVYKQCCKEGSVALPFPKMPPPLLEQLFSIPSFLENIRAYNSMFSMTSISKI